MIIFAIFAVYFEGEVNSQNTLNCDFDFHLPISLLVSFLQRVGIACYADGCISEGRVCLSGCPFVTRWYCVETNEATIMQFSLSDSKIILVSREIKISGNSQGLPIARELK